MRTVLPFTLLIVSLFLGCGESSDPETTPVLRLATTTSTRDSGLLDILLPAFENTSGCRIDVVAVGTGAALKLGASGDADAVLVHAESAEQEFMRKGHGVRREPLMYNSFLLLGPKSDPAQAQGLVLTNALLQIARRKHPFVSRGDESGTHKRERELWSKTKTQPTWDDYMESGRGMGETLVMASELNAYVLSDEATYLRLKAQLDLIPIVEGDENLKNPYAIMVVSPQRTGRSNELATQLVDFMISKPAQTMIDEFKINGRQLFIPLRLTD